MNLNVSIPFIAGQWSLHDGDDGDGHGDGQFQSPSLRGSGRFICSSSQPRRRSSSFQSPSLRGSGRFELRLVVWLNRQPSFNPLHCGAVVASPPPHGGGARRDRVSIPFIAGQWSLQEEKEKMTDRVVVFQSPSLRGSGRFAKRAQARAQKEVEFQSPSLRGSGRFLLSGGASWRRCAVSIPFIAGQWSLLGAAE